MRKLTLCLLIVPSLIGCSHKKETVNFEKLPEAELSGISFRLPNDKLVDSLKEAHNRCMGVYFDANIILFEPKANFFIGTIVNKHSGDVVATTKGLGISAKQAVSQYSMVTTPCYTKNDLHLPLRSILGDTFKVALLGGNETLNTEMNNAILSSDSAEIETGSWIYLDMKDALKNMVDTGKSANILQYKKQLLDTSNIVLIAAENLMNIRIVINTAKDLSSPLQVLLQSSPSAEIPNSTSVLKTGIKFYFFNSRKFQMTIDGFFPIAGQLVKAVCK